MEALEGRHLLRGKVLVVTLTVDLRKRVVRPRVPGLDARSDLEFAQRALFVSQLPQGLAQSEVSLKHGGTGLRSALEIAPRVLQVLLVSVDAAQVDEGCGVAGVQLVQRLEDLERVIPLVPGPIDLGHRAQQIRRRPVPIQHGLINFERLVLLAGRREIFRRELLGRLRLRVSRCQPFVEPVREPLEQAAQHVCLGRLRRQAIQF